jgi:hypothetical protein
MKLAKFITDESGNRTAIKGTVLFMGPGTIEMFIDWNIEEDRAKIVAKREAGRYQIGLRHRAHVQIGTPVLPNKGARRK